MLPQTPNPVALLAVLLLLTGIVVAWIGVILAFAFEVPVVPARRPRIVPWGAGSVLLTILIWFLSQAATGFTYRMVRQSSAPPPPAAAAPLDDATPTPKVAPVRFELKPVELMGLSAVANVVAVGWILGLLRATSGARLRDQGIEAAGLALRVAQGVVAYLLLAPCVFGLMLVAVAIWGKNNHPLQDAMTSDQSPATVALLAFAGVVMAPLSEELVFRGVLLGWLTRLVLRENPPIKPPAEPAWPGTSPVEPETNLAPIVVDEVDAEPADAPPIPPPPPVELFELDEVRPKPTTRLVATRLILANFAVSLIFAALHSAQWPAPVPLLVLSMGLGFLYQRTGSLVGPITLHMTFNGVSTLFLFLLAGSTPPPAPPPTPAPTPKVLPAPVPSPAWRVGVPEFRPTEFPAGGLLTRESNRL